MSELEELIQKLCPNGVEFVPLWSVTAWDKRFNGVNRSMQSKIVPHKYYLSAEFDRVERSFGDVLYLPTGVTQQKRYTTVELAGDYLSEGEIICIPWGGTPNVKYYKGKYVTGDNRIATSLDTNKLSNKYLYYVLQNSIDLISSFYRGAGIQHPNMAAVLSIMIPLPPLPVQREIVRILDSFTELTAELNKKLEEELAARRKQYEFYRDKLLTVDTAITQKPISEIAEISTGSSNTDDAVKNGKYPFYVRSQEPLAKNEYEYDEEAIITAGDGVGVGKVFHYVNGKYALHQRAYRIHPSDEGIDGRFLYHYFIAKFPLYIAKQMYQGSVPSIRRPMLNKFEVSIPPIETQKRIVNILDNFDAICSDLNIGLPAEIEARQRQYEYYRDKLLTFKELEG